MSYDEIRRELRRLNNELDAAGKLDHASLRRREKLIRMEAAERARMEEDARERASGGSGGGGGMGVGARIATGAAIGAILGHVIFKQDSST